MGSEPEVKWHFICHWAFRGRHETSSRREDKPEIGRLQSARTTHYYRGDEEITEEEALR